MGLIQAKTVRTYSINERKSSASSQEEGDAVVLSSCRVYRCPVIIESGPRRKASHSLNNNRIQTALARYKTSTVFNWRTKILIEALSCGTF
jgi:hypothetical protein